MALASTRGGGPRQWRCCHRVARRWALYGGTVRFNEGKEGEEKKQRLTE